MQNILEDANIKLGNVVSDVFGVSGLSMVKALAGGENNPAVLVSLAKGSLVKKRDLLLKALDGKVNDYHRFMLNFILETITFINGKIAQTIRG